MRYIAQRLVQTLAVLFVVTFLTFGLVRVLPGDPAVSILGTTQELAEQDPGTRQRVIDLRERLDLDKPVHVAYARWVKALVVERDLGYSEIRQTEVSELLGTALPRSLNLMLYSIGLSLIIAIPLGILAAYRQGGWLDRALSSGAFGLISLPSFIIAILLVFIFAVQLDWLPSSGVVAFGDDPIEHFKSYLLPATSLALPQAAVYMRVLRTDMIATLKEDFIGTAKAKGMPPRSILLRHAFRPSSFTLLTVTALTIGQLIGGSVIIEFIFNINGMGSQLAGALARSDYIVVQSAVAIIAVFFVLINLTVDILYGLLDPRIRHERAAEPDLALTPLQGAAAPAVLGGEPRAAKAGLGLSMWLAFAWCAVLTLVVVLAPYLPFVKDPDKPSRFIEQGPSTTNWFGTDQLGRDLFARVAWGGRVSLTIGVASLVLGFVIGGVFGLTAGFFRGRYERAVMAAMDIMLSFPSLILALALLAALSPPGETAGSLGKVTFVLTVLAVPALARITRANTLTYSQREFVTAAKAMGSKPRRTLTSEILPNVLPSMISFSFVALAILVVAEGALAFLGLSVEAPAATWGKLIQSGSEKLDDAPHLALIPCGVMFLTLLSLNFIGDRLQARFSSREAAI